MGKIDNIRIPFVHRQSSHCESGVVSNLLFHEGIDISEAMAFGIGRGLFFGYLPFIRVNGLPLTTFRCAVGGIFKQVTRQFGITVRWQKFRHPQKAMEALDRKLAEGTPVGCRTGGYWLPYFPPAFRFHFNMHNLVVYGKRGDDYLISDPVFPDPVVCPRKDLIKARFSKGALAPKGTMYYFKEIPDTIDLPPAISVGIKKVARAMLHTPGPVIGIRGIRFLANQLEKWPRKLGDRRAALYLGQLIRMQEELGTGGGGFRFMFSAFLQEAAAEVNLDVLNELSQQMTLAGDRWREFALMGSRNLKNRATKQESYGAMADILRDCADIEKAIYLRLLEVVKKNSFKNN